MRTDVWQSLHSDLDAGVQNDQETYAVAFGTQTILLPIRALGDGVRGVASLILNQASFAVLDTLADALAAKIAAHKPDVIVAVPTLGLPLGEAVARRLGHVRMIPLSTSRKFWYDEELSVDMSSITSPGQGKRLYLDPRMVPLLTGRVAVIDDVLSSGSSIASVLRLLKAQNTTPTVIGAAMLQGDAWRARVGDCTVEGAFRTPILQKTDAGWVAP
jgi:adenine/guanine phosphoribosyltransferase-like PRPP-binding protein